MTGPVGQSDFDKLRRLPWFHVQVVLTNLAMLCTAGAPMALFAAEMGLNEGQIGILGGMMPLLQVAGMLSIPLIARFGARLVSTVALTLRYLFLLTFIVASFHFGEPGKVFRLMLLGMIGFSIARAISEAAYVPWSQEFTPLSVRGKVAGRNAVFALPVVLVASWVIQTWLDGQVGIERFRPLFVFGIIAGIVGALCYLGLRGGARGTGESGTAPSGPRLAALAEPLGDRNFLLFLVAAAGQYLVTTALGVFLLIFYRGLGLPSGQIIFLAALAPVGAAAGTAASGWLLDRYGTRAVFTLLVMGQIALLLVLPFVQGWSGWLLPATAAVTFLLFGLFAQSAMTVSGVYLLNVSPPAAKEAYTTTHYVLTGIAGGAATWGAGLLLSSLEGQSVTLAGLAFGPFAVLFLVLAVISVGIALAFYLLREDGGLSLRAFIANFATGSPMRALVGIQRFGGETSEDRRRELAFVFGIFGSPLAKKELIEALGDPSFDVRHEAVRALGHLAPHDDVVAALIRVLQSEGLVELQYAALESLGRIRAPQSAPVLRNFIGSPNPFLRARAIRAAGEMRLFDLVPELLAALESDPDPDCRMAAVSALGKIRTQAALPELIVHYRALFPDDPDGDDPRSRVVLLAIAKIVGCEESFAYYLRAEQRQPGHAVVDVLIRVARTAGAVPPAQDLSRIAESWTRSAPGPVWTRLLALADIAARSPHPDSAPVARVVQGLRDVNHPSPALVILIALSLRRVLRVQG